MELKLVGALFLALVASVRWAGPRAVTPAAAQKAKPYEVFYRATVSESLCLLLPGHPIKFVVPPSSQPNDRLEDLLQRKAASGGRAQILAGRGRSVSLLPRLQVGT